MKKRLKLVHWASLTPVFVPAGGDDSQLLVECSLFSPQLDEQNRLYSLFILQLICKEMHTCISVNTFSVLTCTNEPFSYAAYQFSKLYHLHCFVVGACDLSTGEPISSTHTTLVHSLAGSNHLVTACFYTLALDTHWCGVRATSCPVNHLH